MPAELSVQVVPDTALAMGVVDSALLVVAPQDVVTDDGTARQLLAGGRSTLRTTWLLPAVAEPRVGAPGTVGGVSGPAMNQ